MKKMKEKMKVILIIMKNESEEQNEMYDNDNTSVSECSLDVMMDSTTNDATTNSNNYRSDNETDSCRDTDASENGDGDEVGGKRKNRSSKFSPNKRKSKLTKIQKNKLDVNSPRTTRSHGSVKINLWTLDVSPILPARGSKSKLSKSRSISKNILSSSKDFLNSSSLRSSPKKKNNESKDNDSSSINTNNSSNSNIEKNNCNKNESIKTDLNSSSNNECRNKINCTTDSLTNNLKNQTLDKWLTKTPQVVLNRLTDIDSPKIVKHQQQTPYQIQQQKQEILRSKRRFSLLKSNLDNSAT